MWCLGRGLWKNGLSVRPGNTQYPTFDLSDGALRRGQDRLQERRKAAIVIGPAKPGSYAIGVMLVTGAVLRCKAAAP
jgi:hypothetical protein